MEKFRLIFTFVGVTMSEKSSGPKITNLVP
jgi:hypothetical protein